MQELNELVTVVIPTIEGREDFLAEALASVHSQSAGEPSVVYRIDKDREGPAITRNKAVQSVTTPWVQFLDDDDILHEDYFETILPHLDDSNLVYTWCVEDGFAAALDRDFDRHALRGANYIPVTVCVRTELFREAGGFPSGVAYEDWALWLKFLEMNVRFTLVKEKKWTYRRHAGSRTHENHYKIAAGLISEA